VTAVDVVWEVARAAYSLALVVIGGASLRALPRVLEVAGNFTAALLAAAKALTDAAADRDKIDGIAHDVGEIKKVVAELKTARDADAELLDRVRRVLEDVEAERRQKVTF
jgi:hypothetical protein